MARTLLKKKQAVTDNTDGSFSILTIAWKDYTPSLFLADGVTNGASAITKARWRRRDNDVTVMFLITCNGSASFNDYLTLPVNAAYSTNEYNVGYGTMGISSPNIPFAINIFTTAGRVHLAPYTATSFAGLTISGTFSYEV